MAYVQFFQIYGTLVPLDLQALKEDKNVLLAFERCVSLTEKFCSDNKHTDKTRQFTVHLVQALSLFMKDIKKSSANLCSVSSFIFRLVSDNTQIEMSKVTDRAVVAKNLLQICGALSISLAAFTDKEALIYACKLIARATVVSDVFFRDMQPKFIKQLCHILLNFCSSPVCEDDEVIQQITDSIIDQLSHCPKLLAEVQRAVFSAVSRRIQNNALSSGGNSTSSNGGNVDATLIRFNESAPRLLAHIHGQSEYESAVMEIEVLSVLVRFLQDHRQRRNLLSRREEIMTKLKTLLNKDSVTHLLAAAWTCRAHVLLAVWASVRGVDEAATTGACTNSVKSSSGSGKGSNPDKTPSKAKSPPSSVTTTVDTSAPNHSLAAIHLSKATEHLRTIAKYLMSSSAKCEPVHPLILSVAAHDGKALYRLMALQGRILYNAKLHEYLLDIYEVAAKHSSNTNSSSNSQHTYDISELHSVCVDIRLYSLVSLAWTGSLSGSKDREIMRRAVNRSAVVAQANTSWQNRVECFVLGCIDILCRDEPYFAKLSNECKLDQRAASCQCGGCGADCLTDKAAFELWTEQVLAQLVNEISTMGLESYNHNKAWISLLAAKVTLLVFDSPREAHQRAGRMLKTIRDNGMLSLLIPKVEACLFLMDIQEASGNVDDCVGFLAEAMDYVRDSGALAVLNVVNLHSIRVWYRLGADKQLSSVLSQLLSEDENDDEGSNRLANSLVAAIDEQEDKDEVTRRVLSAVNYLCAHVNLSPEWTATTTPDDPSLEYRHLKHFWDIRITNSNAGGDDGSRTQGKMTPRGTRYHVCVPPGRRSQLITYFTSYEGRVVKTKPLMSLQRSNSNSNISGSDYLVNTLLLDSRDNIDIQRNLRRAACIDSLQQQLLPHSTSSDQALRTFLLGASSVGVALTSGIGPSVAKGRTPDVASSMTTANRHIEAVLSHGSSHGSGSSDFQCSFDYMRDALSRLGSKQTVLCFITLDQHSNNMIIGRADCVRIINTTSEPTTQPLTIALPIKRQFLRLMSQWNAAVTTCHSLLDEGSVLAKSRQKQWPIDRKYNDTIMASILTRIQSLLGVWRIMMCGISPSGTAAVESLCSDGDGVQSLIDSIGSMDVSSGKGNWKNKATNSSMANQCESFLRQCSVWVRFILANMQHNTTVSSSSSSDSCHTNEGALPLTENEAVDALAVTAQNWDSTVSADEASEIAQHIVTTICRGKPASPPLTKLPATSSVPTKNSTAKTSVAAKAAVEKPPKLQTAPRAPLDVVALKAKIEKLKVAELQRDLQALALDTSGLKAVLVKRLLGHYIDEYNNNAEEGSGGDSDEEEEEDDEQSLHQSSAATASPPVNITSTTGDARHVILLLDETVQSLPIECMPSMRDISGSRVPSLALLLALASSPSLVNGGTDTASQSDDRSPSPMSIPLSLDARRAWYALDIEGNLPTTQATMQPFLQKYAGPWRWTGYVGQVPDEATFRSHHESSDFFIYCGHGHGAEMGETWKMAQSVSQCPAALLFGCSSGLLFRRGVHDPSGAALDYLLAGAPCVVGNLWNVSDVDLNMLSEECLAAALPRVEERNEADCSVSGNSSVGNTTLDLCAAVVRGRSVCELKTSNGAAAICYGLPVFLHTK